LPGRFAPFNRRVLAPRFRPGAGGGRPSIAESEGRAMSRSFLKICLPAALAITAGAALPASADEACISPKVVEALNACSGNAAERAPGKRAPVKIPIQQGTPSAGKDFTKPNVPGEKESAIQIRRNLANLRAVPLLVTQIQGIESLLQNTPANAPDRPVLIRRAADSYVELEAISFRKKIEGRQKADEIARKDAAGAAAARAEADKSEKIELSARQAAIRHYEKLRADYPRYCHGSATKSSGCLDEVLYDLAYEYEQDQKRDQARKVYLSLIQDWPQSRYIPNAYLAFGELFFAEAQGDPSKWSFAEQSYKEVAKYPAPDNTVLGYAHYKLAYVYWNKGDFVQAMSEFKKTIDFGAQFPAVAGSKGLAISARRDILPVYALAGDPKKAHDFLRPLSGDAGIETSGTYKMMDDLGQAYLDTGHYREGIDLYKDLAGRDKGPKLCAYQGHITEATMAMRSGDKPAIKVEMDRQLDVMSHFLAGSYPDDAKLACKSETAELMVSTAMAWHLEAVGSDGVRGTNDDKTMDLAAETYDKVVRTFTRADFDALKFPKIVKEDWPTRLKVEYAMADLLYARKNWAKCGTAFDGVAAEDPKGPLAAEASYTAAICFQNLYAASHEGHSDRHGNSAAAKGAAPDLSPRDFSDIEKSMLAAFGHFLCTIKPAPGDKEAHDRQVEVAYARARTYFDAHHWEEAAAAFRQVAMDHPESDAGIYAGQLYLEAANVLASRGKAACFGEMAHDVPSLTQKYCTGGKEKDNAEACTGLIGVERDLAWKEAGATVDASKGDPALLEKGANAYLDLWKKYGEAACQAKQPGCARMDQVLTNAARAFQAARLMAKAIAVRKLLVDPRYNLDKTDLARKAVHEIGGNFQAIAVYDEAAMWYERFAKDSPRMDKAAEALQDATILRLGLGQEDQAMRDAELFEKTYGGQKPALASQIAFAVGAHDIEKEDFVEGEKRLSAAMGAIDRSASVDVQIQAHALLGRALLKTGGASGAAAEFAKVRATFKDGKAVIEKLRAGTETGDADRRIGKVLTAVGEAEYFFAEQKRKEVDRIRFPEYKGSGERQDVLNHVHGKVADWIKKKRPAIEEAEKAYLHVLNLPVAPPPNWSIASGARVGQMWGKFVAEFRAAPIPKEWKQHGMSPYGGLTWEEILAAYLEAIDVASEPFKLRAKAAFQTCLDYSVKFQYSDENARSCEVWLAKNYGAEFHVVDEIHGEPTRIGMRVDERPVKLGQDVVALSASP
jgi:tetratricopeptide (TPR) repeat protein